MRAVLRRRRKHSLLLVHRAILTGLHGPPAPGTRCKARVQSGIVSQPAINAAARARAPPVLRWKWAGVDGGFSLLCYPNRLAHSHKYSHTRRYASQATARLNTYGQSRAERLSGSPCSRPCSNQLPQRTPVSQRMQLHKVAG